MTLEARTKRAMEIFPEEWVATWLSTLTFEDWEIYLKMTHKQRKIVRFAYKYGRLDEREKAKSKAK